MKKLLFLTLAVALVACSKQTNATTVDDKNTDKKVEQTDKNSSDAPIIKMATADGKQVTTADLKGKLLYIDVWATWCPPCRAEIPHMKALYEHFKDNEKIEIISISVDEDEAAWKKMITDQKMEWQQFISNGDNVESLGVGYQLRSIPRFIIIGADGSLKNNDAPRPSNEALIPLLNELLEK